MSKQLNGKGWFIPNKRNKAGEWVSGDTIYVREGSWRRSTGLKATKANIAWIKKPGNAQKKIQELRNGHSMTSKTSLKEFGLKMLELTKKNRGEVEQKQAISAFLRMVAPFFKHYSLEDIKPMDIDDWQNKLLETYSTSSVRNVKSRLSMIFEKAIDNDLLGRNPVKRAEPVKLVKKKREIYTRDEMQKILTHSNGWMQVFLYIAFGTGMRTGEIMALQWDDIDLERGVIKVERSIRAGKITQSSEKKNHDRVVIMPEMVWEKVAQYAHHKPDRTWLFVSRKKRHFYETSSIVEKHFKPLLKKLDIPYRTLYATRHTYISLMRNADGIAKDSVQMTVGHKLGSSVTDDVYTTFDTNRLRGHAEAANNILVSVITDKKETGN